MKEWIEAYQALSGLIGPYAALMTLLYVWQMFRYDKLLKSRDEISEKRIEEAMKMTAVIEASKAAADARNETTLQQTSAFQQLTQVVNLFLYQKLPPSNGRPSQ